MAKAELFLGHDSGPMHLAANVGTPCVAVFSARCHPGVWFPRGTGHQVIYHETECAGCMLFTCTTQQYVLAVVVPVAASFRLSMLLFAFLLGSAATVPPAVTPILVVMVLANLIQMVAQSLLLHAGFFREISRIGATVAVAMIVATAISVAVKFDVVGFLVVYALVYTAGALYLAIAAYRGPIRAALPQGRRNGNAPRHQPRRVDRRSSESPIRSRLTCRRR